MILLDSGFRRNDENLLDQYFVKSYAYGKAGDGIPFGRRWA
jgi:hypothetical protein